METPTARERQILALIATGATSGEIARMLGIAEMTMRKHRANLCRKLHCRSAAQLVAHAVATAEAPGLACFRRRPPGPAAPP